VRPAAQAHREEGGDSEDALFDEPDDLRAQANGTPFA
jgi:hypothetical protein